MRKIPNFTNIMVFELQEIKVQDDSRESAARV
jgi:hypothetical protein